MSTEANLKIRNLQDTRERKVQQLLDIWKRPALNSWALWKPWAEANNKLLGYACKKEL